MKANVYKVELLVIDFENVGSTEDVVNALENIRHLSSHVKGIALREVEWSDDHPLNKPDTDDAEYQRLFS